MLGRAAIGCSRWSNLGGQCERLSRAPIVVSTGHLLLSPVFNPQKRELIRLELMSRFGQEPDLANGLFLRTWRDGP